MAPRSKQELDALAIIDPEIDAVRDFQKSLDNRCKLMSTRRLNQANFPSRQLTIQTL